VKNQLHATRGGGYYGAIIGDVRKDGAYSSYQAELISRMPKKELQAVLIKEQHNVASRGTDYPQKMHLAGHGFAPRVFPARLSLAEIAKGRFRRQGR
jgi:hypothetical protein